MGEALLLDLADDWDWPRRAVFCGAGWLWRFFFGRRDALGFRAIDDEDGDLESPVNLLLGLFLDDRVEPGTI